MSNANEQVKFDVIETVQNIYIDNFDVIHICVKGHKAEGGSDELFSYSVPMPRIQEKIKQKENDIYETGKVYITRVSIERTEVYAGCDIKNKKKELAFKGIDLKYAIRENANEAFFNLLNVQSSELFLFEIEVYDTEIDRINESKDLALVIKINPGKFSILYIDATHAMYDGSDMWYFAVPIGLIIDALTYPMQIAAWFEYSSSH